MKLVILGELKEGLPGETNSQLRPGQHGGARHGTLQEDSVDAEGTVCVKPSCETSSARGKEACLHSSRSESRRERHSKLQGRGQKLGKQNKDILLQLPVKNSLQSNIDGNRPVRMPGDGLHH